MSEAELGFRHQRVQRLRRLARQRSLRRAERAFVIEGEKVLDAAFASGAPIEAVYYAPDRLEASSEVLARARSAGVRLHALAPGVLERVADTVTPQAVMAVAGCVDVALGDLERLDLVVVCVDVRDPGNLGTIIRSADAAGASAVVACAGSGDVYNPKVVRASAGSLFHVPIVLDPEPAEVLGELARRGVRRLAALAEGGADYGAADLDGPIAIVLGNEANGLPGRLADTLDGALTIPIEGGAESLNVAMAATVLCFEVARRRRPAVPVPPRDDLR